MKTCVCMCVYQGARPHLDTILWSPLLELCGSSSFSSMTHTHKTGGRSTLYAVVCVYVCFPVSVCVYLCSMVCVRSCFCLCRHGGRSFFLHDRTGNGSYSTIHQESDKNTCTHVQKVNRGLSFFLSDSLTDTHAMVPPLYSLRSVIRIVCVCVFSQKSSTPTGP